MDYARCNWYKVSTDPTASTAPTTAKPAAKRPSVWWGVAITLVGWLILAFPAFIALFLTAAAFSSCFLECSAPTPAAGTVGVVILAAMVVCPPLLAVAVVRGGRPWWIALGVCVLVVVAALVFGAM